jgi:transposase-like protein
MGGKKITDDEKRAFVAQWEEYKKTMPQKEAAAKVGKMDSQLYRWRREFGKPKKSKAKLVHLPMESELVAPPRKKHNIICLIGDAHEIASVIREAM